MKVRGKHHGPYTPGHMHQQPLDWMLVGPQIRSGHGSQDKSSQMSCKEMRLLVMLGMQVDQRGQCGAQNRCSRIY